MVLRDYDPEANFASEFCPKDELRGRDFLREKSYAFSLELYAVILEV